MYLVTCVALRVYTRGFIVRKMGLEDWTMVAAAVRDAKFSTTIISKSGQALTIVFLLQLVVGAKEFKLGFSGMNLTPDQMASNIKVSSLTCFGQNHAHAYS
jgi:hypothetical protein